MSRISRRAFARILLLASGVVLAGACGNDHPTTPAPTPPQPSAIISPTTYYLIRNVETGKVLDVESAGCCNGYFVHQWDYQGLANQQWRVVSLGNGYYKIVARHSTRVLDVRSASMLEGARIHQWTYDESLNQQWYLTDLGSSTYIITARHSGKSLTVSGGPTYYGSLYINGVGIRQHNYNGSFQHWQLEPVQ
jgi:nitrogen regulatory protein PII-like uncharacterized protein